MNFFDLLKSSNQNESPIDPHEKKFKLTSKYSIIDLIHPTSSRPNFTVIQIHLEKYSSERDLSFLKHHPCEVVIVSYKQCQSSRLFGISSLLCHEYRKSIILDSTHYPKKDLEKLFDSGIVSITLTPSMYQNKGLQFCIEEIRELNLEPVCKISTSTDLYLAASSDGKIFYFEEFIRFSSHFINFKSRILMVNKNIHKMFKEDAKNFFRFSSYIIQPESLS